MEWLPLKGMVLTKNDGYNQNEWLPLNKMVSTKKNGFH